MWPKISLNYSPNFNPRKRAKKILDLLSFTILG